MTMPATPFSRRESADVFGSFPISFGDGRYRVTLTLSRQPPALS
jgi:hypothetical protein